MLQNPICLAKTIYRSLKCFTFINGHFAVVSGCDFETSKTPTPENVHVLECPRCGKTSIAWSWHSLEAEK